MFSAIVICTWSMWSEFHSGWYSSFGEPEAQKVLNRFLTQVMINAEDIFGRKYLGHQIVKLLGRLEVVTKGLLDNDPPPSLQMLRQPSFAKLC